MKRINPETNAPFKHGDTRKDGRIFNCYSPKLDSKGFNYEKWLSPIAFEKAKQRSRGSFSKAFNRGRSIVNEYKSKKGCFCCGYNKHPSALDFDHIDPKQKVMAVSQMLALKEERLLLEIEKCQVLCANCHRIKTTDPDLFEKIKNDTRDKQVFQTGIT
jgi:hypothetical protein